MVVTSKKDKNYKICDSDIETYYYSIGKHIKDKYTPYKMHMIDTELFEGEHHPLCKIPHIPDINITDSVIRDDTGIVFNAKTFRGIENINSELHTAIITCQFHSLVKRLEYDITYFGGNIDKNHINAAFYTIGLLRKNIQKLHSQVSTNRFDCINSDLVKTFGKLGKIENIYSRIKKGTFTKEDYTDYLSDIPKDPVKKKLF